jgi:hypothetical protein
MRGMVHSTTISHTSELTMYTPPYAASTAREHDGENEQSHRAGQEPPGTSSETQPHPGGIASGDLARGGEYEPRNVSHRFDYRSSEPELGCDELLHIRAAVQAERERTEGRKFDMENRPRGSNATRRPPKLRLQVRLKSRGNEWKWKRSQRGSTR